jgi:histidinol-phosphate/aromatic aminotransferase/cobyric acid decarboxylase-like protein
LWEQGIAVRYTGGLLRVTCGKTEENKAFCAALERWLQK